MSYLGLSVSFDCLCCGSTIINLNILLFQSGIEFRRQILTSKDNPRTKSVDTDTYFSLNVTETRPW